MKKSLIAIAAMAAVGAASAQSSVTLYGRIDAGIGYKSEKASVTRAVGVTSTAKKTTTGFMSNLDTSSRIGLKGQEDLGNGLAAVFNVEWGFDSMSGAANFAEARRSVVGLKGGFGEVVIGRDYTPVFHVMDKYAVLGLSSGQFYSSRAQGIHYSGDFSGFTINASTGYIANKRTHAVTGLPTNTLQNDKDYMFGLGMGYETGPFSFGIAAQHLTQKNLGGSTRTWQFATGISYDFTAAELFSYYAGQKRKGVKIDQQFGIGVKVPMGAFSLAAAYAYSDYNGGIANVWNGRWATNTAIAGGTIAPVSYTGTGHDLGLKASYAFSKRTSINTHMGRSYGFKASGRSGFKAHQDYFGVGLRHDF